MRLRPLDEGAARARSGVCRDLREKSSMARDRPDVVDLAIGVCPIAVFAEVAREAADGIGAGCSNGCSDVGVSPLEPLKMPALERPGVVAQRE